MKFSEAKERYDLLMEPRNMSYAGDLSQHFMVMCVIAERELKDFFIIIFSFNPKHCSHSS